MGKMPERTALGVLAGAQPPASSCCPMQPSDSHHVAASQTDHTAFGDQGFTSSQLAHMVNSKSLVSEASAHH